MDYSAMNELNYPISILKKNGKFQNVETQENFSMDQNTPELQIQRNQINKSCNTQYQKYVNICENRNTNSEFNNYEDILNDSDINFLDFSHEKIQINPVKNNYYKLKSQKKYLDNIKEQSTVDFYNDYDSLEQSTRTSSEFTDLNYQQNYQEQKLLEQSQILQENNVLTLNTSKHFKTIQSLQIQQKQQQCKQK
ncbi:hypothetical protein PPERSA_09132 [Pseudocohnilembus persalinus]|uniref:Uncharacterized protein n=1 Tax=Pseudocohnilembus persalinus TaxID=266149 RepID=A0A0V0QXD1_PSEPJ|nr:hypothetical protein PPERSA_09132 [Pseudocohnilembus persalinus]|eukprot:KRX06730.1 hypothetical protein PPERSA_09132 [Pseudocohnilembus persalinus]